MPKTYYEQAYPVELDVLVLFSDGTSILDGIKGLNPGHALYNARHNWDTAIAIIPLCSENSAAVEAQFTFPPMEYRP